MYELGKYAAVGLMLLVPAIAQPPGARPSAEELQRILASGSGADPRLVEAKARWPEIQRRIDVASARQDEAIRAGDQAAADELDRLQLASMRNGDATNHYLMGRMFAETKKFADARAAYQKAVDIDPYHWWSWRGLGSTFAVQGIFDQAERNYRKALELEPSDPGTRSNLILAALELEDVERAERLAADGLKLHPEHLTLNLLYARTLMRQSRFREAIPPLARARQIDPMAQGLSYAMAQCQLNTGQLDEARRTLEQHVAQGGNDWRTFVLLGDVIQRQRYDLHKAAEAYERGVALLPESEPRRQQIQAAAERLRAGPDRLPPRRDSEKTLDELIIIGRDDLDPDKRIQAMRILARQDPTRWSQPFLRKFLNGLNDDQGHVRIIVLDALGRWAATAESLGDTDTPFHELVNALVPYLLPTTSMQCQDAHLVRGMAAWVLGHHGNHKVALPKLIEAIRIETDRYAFQQIHEALNRKSFAYIAVDESVDDANRERIRRAWLDWWETQKALYGD